MGTDKREKNNNDDNNNNNSPFLSSAVSSCDLQLQILPILASAPDTDFTDNLTFWTTLTSGQPITGSGANKQRAWDEVYT